jgi:O-antigen/teichoic acid export membrane protein
VLILTLFGSEFRGAIDDLRILVPGAFGIIALKVLGNALTAQGRPGLETAAAGAAFVATLALDILLIPSLGGNGAAIASTLAYTVGGTAAVVIFTRSFRFPPTDLRPRAEEVPRLARELRQMAKRRGRVAAGETR